MLGRGRGAPPRFQPRRFRRLRRWPRLRHVYLVGFVVVFLVVFGAISVVSGAGFPAAVFDAGRTTGVTTTAAVFTCAAIVARTSGVSFGLLFSASFRRGTFFS